MIINWINGHNRSTTMQGRRHHVYPSSFYDWNYTQVNIAYKSTVIGCAGENEIPVLTWLTLLSAIEHHFSAGRIFTALYHVDKSTVELYTCLLRWRSLLLVVTDTLHSTNSIRDLFLFWHHSYFCGTFVFRHDALKFSLRKHTGSRQRQLDMPKVNEPLKINQYGYYHYYCHCHSMRVKLKA